MNNRHVTDRVTEDFRRVRVGAVAKLLPALPVSVRDAGLVKLGAVAKLFSRA